MAKMGLQGRTVTEGNMYAAAHRYARAVFPKDADRFFQDPTGMPPPQPAPNPDLLKIELAGHKAQMQDEQKKLALQVKTQSEQMDRAFQDQQAKFAAAVEAALAQGKHQTDLQKTAVDAHTEEKSALMNALTTLQVAEKKTEETHVSLLMKSFAEQMQQAHEKVAQVQAQHHEQLLQHREHIVKLADIVAKNTAATLRPKELVKEGGRKIVRPVAE
eukprot:GHVU01134691.1.p1 GENE.GHVU01134691.1~~GHVU01134691.1.p1  ORF type:complete len:239 (+),score=57.17 GHVU01134691.1:70-717(+)